jgi:hypothetical protein
MPQGQRTRSEAAIPGLVVAVVALEVGVATVVAAEHLDESSDMMEDEMDRQNELDRENRRLRKLIQD